MVRILKKAIDLIKKTFIVIAVYFVIVSLFLHFINKDRPKLNTDLIKENRDKIYAQINDPKLNSTKEGKITIALFRIASCSLIGEGCTNNPEDGEKYFSRSVFGFISNLIVLPYTSPPASGIYWAYNGLQNAGFVPKTFAAEGIGFGAVKPISRIWNVFRDVAYLVLVLVIVTVGFMIMFRAKINPQTVVSIENSLPKIVLSLIFITFSFAIAGFLIDLMYVLIALVISVIGTAGGFDIAKLQQQYLLAGPGQILAGLTNNSPGGWSILWTLPNAIIDLVPFFSVTIRIIGSLLGLYWIWPWLSNTFGAHIIEFFNIDVEASLAGFLGVTLDGLIKGTAGVITSLVFLGIAMTLGAIVIIPLLLGVVIFITLVFIFFRILFLLFSSYLRILLLVVISPLYLLLEAIPGQSTFTGWLKNLISELLTFPLVIGVFVLASLIISNTSSGELIQFPFLVGINSQSFGFILGMLLLFMTPDLIKMAKGFILPKPMPLEAGIGTFFTGAKGGVETGLGELSKYAMLGQYVKPIGDILGRIVPGYKKPG